MEEYSNLLNIFLFIDRQFPLNLGKRFIFPFTERTFPLNNQITVKLFRLRSLGTEKSMQTVNQHARTLSTIYSISILARCAPSRLDFIFQHNCHKYQEVKNIEHFL